MAGENATMAETATSLVRELRHRGHEALWAGGCVRDWVRGVAPKDYDIATSARPEEVTAIFPGSQTVGAHFGVVVVRRQRENFEIATFRTDGVYRDGRRPDTVTFSTAAEDAQRRDFTVNGLFYDPLGDRVIDYVGGLTDLENRVLRAIGDPAARLREDHLRLLRAVRFATVLDFAIEPATWQAVRDHADDLRHIAIERCREELVKILLHPNRLRGFDLLCDSGLMAQLLPEILALRGCDQPPQFHPEGDVFVHTRLMLSLLPAQASLPLVLSVLLHDIAKPATRRWDPVAGRVRFNEHDKIGAQMAGEILRRLKFDNETIEATVIAVTHHMTFMHVQQMRTAKLRRMFARPTFPDELALHRVDCLGSNGQLDNYAFVRAKLEEFSREPLLPPRLLTGRNLIDLGLPPGPRFKALLEQAQDLQLEGQLTTEKEALAWARTQLASPPPA